MKGLSPTASVGTRRCVLSFLPTPGSCLAMTAAGCKAESLLQGASASGAKSQTHIDIFDLKPQRSAQHSLKS